MVSVSCFGVRFSVMFHFMFVHYTFGSVWVAEWPPSTPISRTISISKVHSRLKAFCLSVVPRFTTRVFADDTCANAKK